MICVFRFGVFAFSGYVPKVFRANNLPGAFFVFNVFCGFEVSTGKERAQKRQWAETATKK